MNTDRIIEINGMKFNMTAYDYVKYDDKKIVVTVHVPKTYTANDINTIVCGFMEGHMNDWAWIPRKMGINSSLWEHKNPNIPASDYATMLLLSGYSVQFADIEDDTTGEDWKLTLDKLIKGIQLNIEKRPHDCDIEVGDAITYDCIIQYALFGDVVYG